MWCVWLREKNKKARSLKEDKVLPISPPIREWRAQVRRKSLPAPKKIQGVATSVQRLGRGGRRARHGGVSHLGPEGVVRGLGLHHGLVACGADLYDCVGQCAQIEELALRGWNVVVSSCDALGVLVVVEQHLTQEIVDRGEPPFGLLSLQALVLDDVDLAWRQHASNLEEQLDEDVLGPNGRSLLGWCDRE